MCDSADNKQEADCQEITPRIRQRACDSCYQARAKCLYAETDTSCLRCGRLGRACISIRPVRPAGRKRLLPFNQPGVSAQPAEPTRLHREISPLGPLTKRLLPVEEWMLRRFLDPANFNELMPARRVGPTMVRQALSMLLLNFGLLKDGYFAMYEAFAEVACQIPFPFSFEANIRRGANAVQKFRRLSGPVHADDFVPWLWLGNVIVLHANFALGSSSFVLRRHILVYIQGLGARGEPFKSHPVAISMIVMDISNSLLRAQAPIMDLPHCDMMDIDPFFAVCAPIIRLLYQLGKGLFGVEIVTTALTGDWVAKFERSISSWEPSIGSELIAQLSASESIHGLTQVRIYKIAAQLYLHRVIYPFGDEDSAAQIMSQNIVSDLRLATAAAGHAPKWVAFPFLVAAVEAVGADERHQIINDAAIYVGSVSTRTRSCTQSFLESVWELRDTNSAFKWITMVDRLPEVFVGA